ERQVRVEGSVCEVPREQAQAYFATRPRSSQLGAVASRQSRPVASRAALEAGFAAAEARFERADVTCPDTWGGYRLVPERIEFWQGRRSRLHDRLRYEAGAAGWTRRRLQP
ncbi:MAG: pyridoxal 5'-phosphate synthase, partial [Arachnia sp.]